MSFFDDIEDHEHHLDVGAPCRPRRRSRKRKGIGSRQQKLYAVALRDDWCCKLCGGAVDLSLPITHAKAATLDHVVPKANGGSNHISNLQLAHRRCNEMKGCGPPPPSPPSTPVGMTAADIRRILSGGPLDPTKKKSRIDWDY